MSTDPKTRKRIWQTLFTRSVLPVAVVIVFSGPVRAEASEGNELASLRDIVEALRETVDRQAKEIEELKAERESLNAEVAHLTQKLNEARVRDAATIEEASPESDVGDGNEIFGDDDAVLGVSIVPTDTELRKLMMEHHLPVLPKNSGVLVTGISLGSPAQLAGVQRMDVIISLAGMKITDLESFTAARAKLTVGQPTTLTVRRPVEPTGRSARSRVRPHRSTANKKRLLWLKKEITVTPQSMKTIMEAAKQCPLLPVSATLAYNSIGQPTVSLSVKNLSDRDVVAYTAEIHCFDRFDRPVNHWASQTNIFKGISQRTIERGQIEGQNTYWTLHGHDNTANVKITLTKVRSDDGSEWIPGEEVSITAKSTR